MRRVFVLSVMASLLPVFAVAQGTKLWSVDRYDGCSAGRPRAWLFAAMAGWRPGRLLPCSIRPAGVMCGRLRRMRRARLMWGWAGAVAGSACGDAGGAPDGKATKVFEGKELGVQAVRVGSGWRAVICDFAGWEGLLGSGECGDCDGERGGGAVRSGADGGEAEVYLGCGAGLGRARLWLRVLRLRCIGWSLGGVACRRAMAKPSLLFKTADQHIRCLLAGAGWDALGGK